MTNKKESIQTGLRIPVGQYERVKAHADRIGVSINQICLMLIDMGLTHFEQED